MNEYGPVELVDAQATRAFGARLARLARPGDLLVLSGPLGAGKTTLTQGLGQALGVRGRVSSPTFIIARVHPGPTPLVHVDAYRITSLDDLETLDLDATLDEAVTVVEWGSGKVESLADSRLEITLSRPEGGLDLGEDGGRGAAPGSESGENGEGGAGAEDAGADAEADAEPLASSRFVRLRGFGPRWENVDFSVLEA
ncbi:tRNA (adenosine(37)-N6)-threonylcarbamoyltransferase complex ATPase subunit type 1 TsaE [Buchananella felis]|uniref:tRNA (adenosine(37)-N6)-threonylcarbamoyltransferase complex ATPase subunit type 1 TsaE n=1 Tax=Buchananella felis TaxID=3231492 RepID=UPI003527381F